MTRIAKLYARALANPRGLSFKEFEQLLLALGFVHRRNVGSHRHYKHPNVPEILTILPEGKAAKGYQVRKLLDTVTAFGLTLDDE